MPTINHQVSAATPAAIDVSSTLEERLEAAKDEHSAASVRLAALLREQVAVRILEFYPAAAVAYLLGEYNDDGDYRLRLQQVTAADGTIMADLDKRFTEGFGHLTDEVDQELEWMGSLDGEDDWLGEQQLDLAELAASARSR